MSNFSHYPHQRIVFCDFDGTITAMETFVGMIKEFAPELSAQLLPKIYNRTLTLKAGVRKLLGSIPSSRYPEILAYAADKPIHSGLADFLDFLETKNVPFIIISAGIREMIEMILEREDLRDKVTKVFAVDLDTSGEYLRVYSQFESETEMMAKAQVMDNYSAPETIAIGDSITDLNMALKANLVFARDHLIEYLKTEDKPCIEWQDFSDIQNYLSQWWQE